MLFSACSTSPIPLFVGFFENKNQLDLKRQPTQWERIFANVTNKQVIIKISKQLIQHNIKKKKKPIKKWAEDLSIHSPKKSGGQHLKKCSTSLIIREMNIKTTMGYHFTPVRMTIIKMSTDKINAGEGVGEKGILQHCWWECKLVQLLWRTV